MKSAKRKVFKVLAIVLVSILVLTGAGYLYLQHLIGEVKQTLTGCNLESSNFVSVVDFDYVSNWIVVKVKVDESDKEYDFIFDTGAQTVISDSLLKEADLQNIKSLSIITDTAGNAFRNKIVSLGKVAIGNVNFSDVGALVVDNAEYKMLNCISPYGIIGYNVLQTCCFQIDYNKKQITITDQVEKLDNFDKIQWTGYTTISQETPIITATINDSIRADLFFDTGFSGAVNLSSSELYKAIAANYPDETAVYTSKPTITIAGGGDIESFQKMLFKTSSFSMGPTSAVGLVVAVEDVPEWKYTGLIGNVYFMNYVITLDYKNKRVGFIPNRIPVSKTRQTFGFSYTPLYNKLFVNSVYVGSDAEAQGISVGDEVISINGIKVSDLPPESFCEMYRKEFTLVSEEEDRMIVEILRNGETSRYELMRYLLF